MSDLYYLYRDVNGDITIQPEKDIERYWFIEIYEGDIYLYKLSEHGGWQELINTFDNLNIALDRALAF